MTEFIFRQPDPTKRPWMVGRMPSASGGRVLDFSAGYTQEGESRLQSTDRGAVRDSDDPFFYLCVFGGTLAMNERDMHECVEEMVQTRQEAEKQKEKNLATSDQLKQKIADLVEAINDAQVGRTRFAT